MTEGAAGRTNADGLKTEVADWLEAERRSTVAHLQRAGAPTSIAAQVPVVTEMSETQLGTTEETRAVNALTVNDFTIWRALEGRVRSPSPAAAIHAALGDQCWYQQGYMQP